MPFDSQKFRQRLIESSLAEDDLIIGCTTQEIEHVEHENDIILPLAYKEFLLTAGRRAGSFMKDCDVFYPGIIKLDKIVHETSGDYFSKQEPCFVFINNDHSGYFCYFYRSCSDDPEIYGWRGRDEIFKCNNSFSEFMDFMLVHYGA
jgi:hypothetical protein